MSIPSFLVPCPIPPSQADIPAADAAATGERCCWAVSFASLGSGGWRSDYSLAAAARPSAALTCVALEAGLDNLLVRFAKPAPAVWLEELALWASPEAAAATVPSVLVRMPNVGRQLTDCLAGYASAAAAARSDAVNGAGGGNGAGGLVVTELCGERLAVRLDGQGEDVRDKPAAALQQVTQQVLPPQPLPLPPQSQQPQQSLSRLHGILKFTRSPSLSSSDELSSSLSSSQGQQHLVQQQQQQHLLLNRSVSFSDHVESANYT